MGYGKLAKGISQEEVRRRLEEVMPSQERKKDFQGVSPPSVFIGSHNYPKVNTGVLSPQHHSESQLMDSPADWYHEDYSIEKVASLRTSLVNSKQKLKVEETDNFLDNTREVAMARKPVDIEVSLDKRPGANISGGGRAAPVSASGDVEKFNLGENPTVERKIEKAFYDTDLKAKTAVKELHSKGVNNYKIQQTLSTGMLGEEENRELVPTRWSITATDDMLSKRMRRNVKTNHEINQIEYYRNEYVGNIFHIFLIPGRWEYELMEMKRSGSVWNAAQNTYIAQNYEPFSGRTSYAEETAGAFYATRLGIMEHLNSRGRQAKAIVLREVTPKYWAPLGVWVIRETVRNAFDNPQEAEELDDYEDLKFKVSRNFRFLYNRIRQNSKMLGSRQTDLTNF
jgi:hypothetical protein